MGNGSWRGGRAKTEDLSLKTRQETESQSCDLELIMLWQPYWEQANTALLMSEVQTVCIE